MSPQYWDVYFAQRLAGFSPDVADRAAKLAEEKRKEEGTENE